MSPFNNDRCHCGLDPQSRKLDAESNGYDGGSMIGWAAWLITQSALYWLFSITELGVVMQ